MEKIIRASIREHNVQRTNSKNKPIVNEDKLVIINDEKQPIHLW